MALELLLFTLQDVTPIPNYKNTYEIRYLSPLLSEARYKEVGVQIRGQLLRIQKCLRGGLPSVSVFFLWLYHYLHHIISRANLYLLMPLVSTVMTFKPKLYAVTLYSLSHVFNVR